MELMLRLRRSQAFAASRMFTSGSPYEPPTQSRGDLSWPPFLVRPRHVGVYSFAKFRRSGTRSKGRNRSLARREDGLGEITATPSPSGGPELPELEQAPRVFRGQQAVLSLGFG